MTTDATVTVEPYVVDVAGIRKGSVKLSDVLSDVAPVEEVKVPEVLPVPAEITEAQQASLKALTKHFGKVVPTERRELETVEVVRLYEERKTLDDIEELAKTRKANIRTTILNHFDARFEREREEAQAEGGDQNAPRDKEGHVLHAARENVATTDQAWSWEMRGGTAVLTAETLAQLDAAGEIPHNLYLAMTTQVRVVNENRILELLTTDDAPDVLEAMRKASTKTAGSGALFLRKQK